MKAFIINNKVHITELNKTYNTDYKDILDFKIIWSCDGIFNLRINKKDVIIGNNEFVILMPEHQVNFNDFTKNNFHIISFSVDYLQIEAKSFSIDLFKLFIKNSANHKLEIKTEDVKQIDNLLQMIFKLNMNEVVDEQIAIFLINAMLLLIIKNNHDFVSTPDKYFNRIHDFFLLIFNYSKTEKKVTFYADKLAISPKRLNQILLAYTGRTASYFIQEHLIMQAKHLLLNSEKNITEIANELGFEDIAYFSRFFKRWMNISPEKFRTVDKIKAPL